VSIRVVVCDDHRMVLDGLAQVLSLEPDIEVVATCADVSEALTSVQAADPDVLVVDYRLGKETGVDVLQCLNDRNVGVASVIVSAMIDDAALLDILGSDTLGVVLKESASVDLVECIRSAARGQRMIPQPLLDRGAHLRERLADRSSALQELTSREADVVEAVAAGSSNKKIAKELGISESTVKTHLHRIFRKVGVNNRVQLSLMARHPL